MLREGAPIGLNLIWREFVQSFSDRQVDLVKTFADQAVIAIENVRLFKELQERNSELREALEHQTATSEVLGIISRSPTDVQPVLDAIVESAAKVCRIDDVVLRLRHGDTYVAAGSFWFHTLGRAEISIDEPQYRWISEHGALHIPDVRAQNEFPVGFSRSLPNLFSRSPSPARRIHWRTVRASHRGVPVHPGADQAARDFCRPSCNRNRECPLVPRAQRVIRAADRDE